MLQIECERYISIQKDSGRKVGEDKHGEEQQGRDKQAEKTKAKQRRRNEIRIKQANPSLVNPLSVFNKNSTLSKEKKEKETAR